MTTTETTEQEPRKRAKRTRKPKAAAEPSGDATAPETAAETAADAPSPRKRATKAKPATEARETPADAEAAQPVPRKKAAKGGPTLRELAERFIAHLEDVGKSEGTCFSYRMELRLALEAIGEDTPVAKITVADVAGFFESDPVTRTRSGVEKSPLSVAKTRRVLRQALTYAVAEGLIEKAPLPEKA